MKPRTLFLAGAIGLLAALNAWHWSAPPRKTAAAPAPSAFRAQDFELRAGSSAAAPLASTRDIFQPRLAPPAPPPPAPKVVEAPPPPPSGPPPKTPEQIAEEAARDELRQIKLVGVVFRDGKGHAFLVKGDQVYMVHTGGSVGERFRVEAIAPDGIQLSDPASRVQGQLPVSGK